MTVLSGGVLNAYPGIDLVMVSADGDDKLPRCESRWIMFDQLKLPINKDKD